jgi:hypothetical protein
MATTVRHDAKVLVASDDAVGGEIATEKHWQLVPKSEHITVDKKHANTEDFIMRTAQDEEAGIAV